MSFPKLGKYEVVGVLGRGAVGLVYKARDPDIGRFVAIKTVKPEVRFDQNKLERAKQRFKQEFRAVGKVLHPNIVTIFDAGFFSDGMPFIVMEYLRGLRFTQFVKDNVKLSAEDYLHLLKQISSAIDFAHSQNVYHQDIKPGNVIVTRGSIPKLVDFGVSKRGSLALGDSNEVVGTPSYMSPEQLRGVDKGGSSDRFAFAVMSYELLTGKRPFEGDNVEEIASRIIHDEPVVFEDKPFSQIKSVFITALEKEPANRFQTCEHFMTALETAIDSMSAHEREELFSDDRHLNQDFRPSADTKSMEVYGSRRGDAVTRSFDFVTHEKKDRLAFIIGVVLALFIAALLAFFVLI